MSRYSNIDSSDPQEQNFDPHADTSIDIEVSGLDWQLRAPAHFELCSSVTALAEP